MVGERNSMSGNLPMPNAQYVRCVSRMSVAKLIRRSCVGPFSLQRVCLASSHALNPLIAHEAHEGPRASACFSQTRLFN